MTRWIWWVPLAVFALWWGWLGFRWGWIATTTTQTDVIEVYAQRYLADRTRDGTGEGARLTDCVAYPGPDAGIWLHVVCKPMPPDFLLTPLRMIRPPTRGRFPVIAQILDIVN